MADDPRFPFNSRVPVHLRPGLVRYIDHGVVPGGFLFALLCNDMAKAAKKADALSLAALPYLAGWLETHAPEACWGSLAKVNRWLADHAAQRRHAAGGARG